MTEHPDNCHGIGQLLHIRGKIADTFMGSRVPSCSACVGSGCSESESLKGVDILILYVKRHGGVQVCEARIAEESLRQNPDTSYIGGPLVREAPIARRKQRCTEETLRPALTQEGSQLVEKPLPLGFRR